MPKSKLVALLFETWNETDRVFDGLEEENAVRQHHGGSSFAWTLAHVANQVDARVNVGFHGAEPHPLISQDRFRFGGTGEAEDWDAIRQGVAEIRDTARAYLDGLDDQGLDATAAYTGFSKLRGRDISLRYVLYRVIAHHYFHIGEVASKRDLLGHSVGDYPGLLEGAI